jgi:hypothetical protein
MVQILCTHVCKWKNDTNWNYPRNGGGRECIVVEGVNSSMIYLIHCKNFCKCHNVPPTSTTINNNNNNKKQTRNMASKFFHLFTLRRGCQFLLIYRVLYIFWLLILQHRNFLSVMHFYFFYDIESFNLGKFVEIFQRFSRISFPPSLIMNF